MDPVVANQSFFSKYKFTLISIFVILLAAVPLLLLSNTAKKTVQQQPTTTMVSPTPQVTLTQQNADAVLGQTDTDMQTTLNQTDIDLQAASQVDTTQDSTAGL